VGGEVMTKEALTLALEALENHSGNYKLSKAECAKHEIVITAIKEALAQPEQEPVAFYRCNGCGHEYQQMHPTSCDCMKGSSFEQVNYYTAPPQRKPLTDEQIEPIAIDVLGYGALRKEDMELFTQSVRAIEAAHGIKE